MELKREVFVVCVCLIFGGDIGTMARCRVYWVYGEGGGECGCMWVVRFHQCGALRPVRQICCAKHDLRYLIYLRVTEIWRGREVLDVYTGLPCCGM